MRPLVNSALTLSIVAGLMFGAEDFALDIGLATLREGEAAELMYARSAMVIAAVASRKLSFDGVWPDISDADGLRRDSLRARRLRACKNTTSGFGGFRSSGLMA